MPGPKAEPEVIYVELPAPETETIEIEIEKDNSMLIVIISVVAFLGICLLNVLLCKLCLGKYQNRIKILETQTEAKQPANKPSLDSHRWANHGPRKRPIAVNSAFPDDDEKVDPGLEAVEIDTMRYEIFDESSR